MKSRVAFVPFLWRGRDTLCWGGQGRYVYRSCLGYDGEVVLLG
jgi:hypothetical protein